MTQSVCRALCVVVLMAVTAGCAQSDREAAAQAAAQAWLAEVDAGRYDSSWAGAAELFKRQVSARQWRNAMERTREPLGNVTSRHIKNAAYTTSLPGVPDGEYVVLQFDTVFANKASAVETVTPMLDGGQWRVSGYFIK